MPFIQFMSEQFAKPSGLFGRLFMGRYLDRANQQGNQLVLETLNIAKDSTVLEIGFGGGDLLIKIAQQLQNGRLFGVEISDAMFKHCQQRIRNEFNDKVSLHMGSVEDLPFEDEIFDRICSVNTLYFWPDLDAGIKQICRALKSDGRCVLGFGCPKSLAANGYEQRGFSLYTPEQIEQAFTRNGLIAEELNSIQRNKRGPFYAYRAVKPK